MRIQMMRVLLFGLAVLGALVGPAAAERGDDTDRASKNGRTTGTIDGVEIVIEYGRPNVKSRKIWGALVPYGRVWRTGADEATTISFSADVAVEGEPLAAGRYGLFTLPERDEWTVIFNKVADQWGAFNYDAAKDALRVKVRPQPAQHAESLDFVIDGSAVVLRWEQLAVSFRVSPGA